MGREVKRERKQAGYKKKERENNRRYLLKEVEKMVKT